MADVKLKDKNGALSTYAGVGRVALPTGEGTAVFYDREPIEKTVQLAFSGDDTAQTVEAEAGKSFSSVTIEKPAGLLAGNIRTGVSIAGIDGTLNPDAYQAKLAVWGDATGKGNIIATPDYHGIRVWGPGDKNIYWVDAPYKHVFSQMQTLDEDLNTGLAFWASGIMTRTENCLSEIFSGAGTALFMDEAHPVPIPTVTDTDARNWTGLRAMLMRTLENLPDFWMHRLFQDAADYGTDHTSEDKEMSDNYLLIHGKKTFPFVWYPGISDGTYTAAYTVQEPTGQLPSYEDGFVFYEGDTGRGIVCANFNASETLGLSAPVFIGVFGAAILWRSEGAQTVPQAFMQQFEPGWDFGDVSLAQGWNLSTYSQGTFVTAPTTLAQAKAMIEENFGNFDPAWLPFDEMDEYTKSFFAPISGTKYKRLGNDALRIEFNLYGKDGSNG